MRKILVASQKGGVGKTTTSINLAAAAAGHGRVLLLDADPLSNVSTALRLAEHPNRSSLRAAGSNVPGVLVTDLIPGLDVLSPYEDGGCSDDDFESLLRLLDTAEFRNGYDLLVVDAPPFFGAKPAQLLATCDEYVLVMRAEANAHRTLPALQELVQRSKRNGKPAQLCGILLTLPEGEDVGGRWEHELRGRLGTRILPEVIPFDLESERTRDAGGILVQSAPASASALQYAQLVETLGLHTRQAAVRSAECPVLRAALALGQPAVAVPEPALSVPCAIAAPPPPLDQTMLPPRRRTMLPPTRRAPALEPAEEPELPTDVGAMMSMPEIPVLHLRRRMAERPTAQPNRKSETPPKVPKTPKPAAPASRTPQQSGSSTPQLAWIGAAVVMGFGLRFVQIPPRLVPLVIGAAVTAGALLLLRLLLVPSDSTAATPVRPNKPRPSGESKTNARLSAMTRRRRSEDR